MQITALEQLKEEMQEELLQQSVDATKLHTLNDHLTAQLAKADDRNATLQVSITALADDKLKVVQCLVLTRFLDDVWSSSGYMWSWKVYWSLLCSYGDLLTSVLEASILRAILLSSHRVHSQKQQHHTAYIPPKPLPLFPERNRACRRCPKTCHAQHFMYSCVDACLRGGKALMAIDSHQSALKLCRLSGRARYMRAHCRR